MFRFETFVNFWFGLLFGYFMIDLCIALSQWRFLRSGQSQMRLLEDKEFLFLIQMMGLKASPISKWPPSNKDFKCDEPCWQSLMAINHLQVIETLTIYTFLLEDYKIFFWCRIVDLKKMTKQALKNYQRMMTSKCLINLK